METPIKTPAATPIPARVFTVTAIDESGMEFNHKVQIPSSFIGQQHPVWWWAHFFKTVVGELLRLVGEDCKAEWFCKVEDMEIW